MIVCDYIYIYVYVLSLYYVHCLLYIYVYVLSFTLSTLLCTLSIVYVIIVNKFLKTTFALHYYYLFRPLHNSNITNTTNNNTNTNTHNNTNSEDNTTTTNNNSLLPPQCTWSSFEFPLHTQEAQNRYIYICVIIFMCDYIYIYVIICVIIYLLKLYTHCDNDTHIYIEFGVCISD